jgi:hypothetical protein
MNDGAGGAGMAGISLAGVPCGRSAGSSASFSTLARTSATRRRMASTRSAAVDDDGQLEGLAAREQIDAGDAHEERTAARARADALRIFAIARVDAGDHARHLVVLEGEGDERQLHVAGELGEERFQARLGALERAAHAAAHRQPVIYALSSASQPASINPPGYIASAGSASIEITASTTFASGTVASAGLASAGPESGTAPSGRASTRASGGAASATMTSPPPSRQVRGTAMEQIPDSQSSLVWQRPPMGCLQPASARRRRARRPGRIGGL